MASVNILRIARPTVLPEMGEYYAQHLQHRISIEELVGMMLFVEYFAQPEDRDFLRGTYFTTLHDRFKRHDLGRKELGEVMVDSFFHGANLNIRPYMLNRAATTYVKDTIMRDIDPAAKPRVWCFEDDLQLCVGGIHELMRYRNRHQQYFLDLTEKIDHLYHAIREFYLHSQHHPQLTKLAGICYGGVPNIASHTATHIDIHVIIGESY